VFDKLLIANRGEIACRVIRTARRMGIRTVAVYSEADARALHVALADEALPIGPAPARQSYLDIRCIVAAAQASGAQAVHPGYGFLAENADFAAACAAAGIIFIGPPPDAIRAMGSKAAAKALMEGTGVPLVPGYHGEDQDPETLAAAARRLGFPVLIKASAGGGGKGMRVVQDITGFAAALASAKRESAASFGDDRMLVEKYLTRPRHIEVQVFADTQGNALHLFERDCSVQRRHQKVVEEAPAPGLSEERRRAMGEAAVAAARAVGYVGAGTVEFIAEDGAFYFMEMNTRLQVEHPVTELVTGQDLVEWQIRVAAGESLPCAQEDLVIHGHAVEVRLYAEDPAKGFLPATGVLRRLRWPALEAGMRIDTGVREGDAVTVHYDPMIAKLVAWGEDRGAARRRLAAMLAGTRVAGLATNRDFLLRVLRRPAFAAGAVDTGFIERHADTLLPPAAAAPCEAIAAASLAVLLDQAAEAAAASARQDERHSPWARRDGWRLNGDTYQDLRFREGETLRAVRIHYRSDGYALELDGETVMARIAREAGDELRIDLDGRRLAASVLRLGADVTVMLADASWRLIHVDPLAPRTAEDASGGHLTAPMPGKVTAVPVAAGARVKRGEVLLVLEAMKMEHTLAAPADGKVKSVRYAVGEQVPEGAELVEFE
jgi:3-methylcrotonyl-CoA carboxylase alpha subunit